MDVARAKSIIIIMLIAFNLLLLVNNLSHAGGKGVPKETIRNTEAILKQRGVILVKQIHPGISLLQKGKR